MGMEPDPSILSRLDLGLFRKSFLGAIEKLLTNGGNVLPKPAGIRQRAVDAASPLCGCRQRARDITRTPNGLPPLGVDGRQGPQLVIAVQEIGDGALGDHDATARELEVDLRDAAVLGIAELPPR